MKIYRAVYNLTQEALAEKLAVTRQTILAIEKGKYDPSLRTCFPSSRNSLVSLLKKFSSEVTQCENQPPFED
ncbi:MAG: helix-turn-helix transcriptional regulator [Bacillus subtilis]|nr:helix-turn-helix transcriptional regulator [Bacillus subtilis]